MVLNLQRVGLLISPAGQSNKSRVGEKRARSGKVTSSADPVGLRYPHPHDGQAPRPARQMTWSRNI
jgi:hypothetical protein